MADKHPKSLRKAKVSVDVEPKDDSVDYETAGKIARSLRKDIKRALKEHEDKPSDEQVGKVMGKVTERQEDLEKEGKDVDIAVGIVGERGEDGAPEAHAKGTGSIAKELIDEEDFEDEDDEDVK